MTGRAASFRGRAGDGTGNGRWLRLKSPARFRSRPVAALIVGQFGMEVL
jgi:hypothetical protein